MPLASSLTFSLVVFSPDTALIISVSTTRPDTSNSSAVYAPEVTVSSVSVNSLLTGFGYAFTSTPGNTLDDSLQLMITLNVRVPDVPNHW